MPLTPQIFEEIPKEAYKTPTIKTSDEELLKIARAWETESSQYHDQLEQFSKVNEEYYKGKQTEMDRIPSDMSNSVQNQIFMGVETVVPIVTANPPQFVVEPPEESDFAVQYSQACQRVLGVHYETKDVRTKGEMLMRHMILYRFGAWKPFWNEAINDVDVKWVRPKRLYFPKVVTSLPYIMEKMDITAEEFKDNFGEDTFKEFLRNRGIESDDVNNINGIYTIWEIWNPYLVFWKSGTFIIKKLENPYFDFNDSNRNHFAAPKIPYIIASAFRLGNEPVGETDLIQQTIPIQDVINVANRLIINNATKTGNNQVLIDSSIMSEEEARNKITNAPGLIVYGSGVANPNLFRRDTPPPLPAYIENLKIMSERAFDNIFGTHSTTRGERGQPETLGGRILLKEADIGRIDLLVREYERCVTELGNWWAQLMKLYYVGTRTFKFFGETGLNFVKLMPEMIARGIRIVVKSGTTLPTDEFTKRNEAIQLWSLGAIDPVTLFERLKFPNPQEAAQKLMAFKQGQLMMEQQLGGGASSTQGRSVKPMPSPAGEVKRATKETTGGI